MGKGCFFLNNTNKTKKKPASSLSKQEDVQCQFSNNAAHLLSEKKMHMGENRDYCYCLTYR